MNEGKFSYDDAALLLPALETISAHIKAAILEESGRSSEQLQVHIETGPMLTRSNQTTSLLSCYGVAEVAAGSVIDAARLVEKMATVCKVASDPLRRNWLSQYPEDMGYLPFFLMPMCTINNFIQPVDRHGKPDPDGKELRVTHLVIEAGVTVTAPHWMQYTRGMRVINPNEHRTKEVHND